MNITNSIKYVGVNDRTTDLFEGQYVIPDGISYNSYVIKDEKIAIMDTVDKAFGEEWLSNIRAALGDKAPDYLVVHHMEPDHSSNIVNLVNAYPEVKIVASAKAFSMMKSFFGTDFADRQVVVNDGSELLLYGFKVEGPGTAVKTTNGGVTEIYGFSAGIGNAKAENALIYDDATSRTMLFGGIAYWGYQCVYEKNGNRYMTEGVDPFHFDIQDDVLTRRF